MTKANAAPTIVARKGSNEIWAKYAANAKVWELFASEECDDYLGAFAETFREAKTIAHNMIIGRPWE